MAHNNTLEILMTGVPAIIMVVVAVMTLTTHLNINSYDDANAMPVVVEGESTDWEPKIVVVGNQWWWEFRYYFGEDVTADSLGSDMKNLPPADIVTSGQMIIPTVRKSNCSSPRATSSTRSGSRRSTASATRAPASLHPGRSKRTTPACTSVSARSSAASRTLACACRRSQ